ncbi:uncharacterized protein LOC115633874 [Scaptodrosophila lebanonensis]|uniref:Uncharacterized protein LOC115633874 n=1 Tax=Drosophila lebanonensis TaxID=7225 RepID=A0A6J2UGJ1_DROLE|nr:uncharacterized protein LOC115633874 [Scaptodrosophila lebanonensis]
MAKGHEYNELRDLLRSWNVSELLPHFQDQAINVEELQMIRRYHLPEILHNFSYGTRIRFEHHLERWRRWQNIPLLGSQQPTHCRGCRCSDSPPCPPISRHPSEINVQTQPLDMMDDKCNELMTEPIVGLNEMDSTVPLPLSMPMPLGGPSDLVQTHVGAGAEEVVKTSSAENNVSVLSILQASGSKGQSLLDLRGQREELQQCQRLLLIQLICAYYGDNDRHLTLQRSHLLEREILQLFPGEQLCYYRTERRGKIYVKFTNMKRFRREREPKRRAEESMTTSVPTQHPKIEVSYSSDQLSNS